MTGQKQTLTYGHDHVWMLSDEERRRIGNIGKVQERLSRPLTVLGRIITVVGILYYIFSDTTVIGASMYHNGFFISGIGIVLAIVGAVLRVRVDRRRSAEKMVSHQKKGEAYRMSDT